MPLFEIRFVMGKTDAADYGQVKHTLQDLAGKRVIISLSVSGDKLQSVSNYMREPKRLEFECIPTAWIRENILSGENEHERYISHYEVQAYRNGTLFFSGIIDTSQLSYDVASGVAKFLCFDKIKLLSVFGDLTHYYSLTAGYLPQWILSYFLQDIGQTIPIAASMVNDFTLPELEISYTTPLVLAEIEYLDMLSLPSGGGWTYILYSSTGPNYGFRLDLPGNKVMFAFKYWNVVKAVYADPPTYRYKGKFRGRVLTIFNNICPVVKEYDQATGWQEDDDFTQEADELMKFFADNGISATQMGQLQTTAVNGEAYYGLSHWNGHWVQANFHGNVMPAKLQPGKSYETNKTEQTENLKALQALLMLYNATVVCDAQGRICLKNKDNYSASIVEIEDEDVISLVTKRGNQEKPAGQTLEALAGDTTKLQEQISQYLTDYFNGKWSIEATIDQIDKYAIALQSKIQIQDEVYAVNEVERDYLNDEYKVKAWLL